MPTSTTSAASSKALYRSIRTSTGTLDEQLSGAHHETVRLADVVTADLPDREKTTAPD